MRVIKKLKETAASVSFLLNKICVIFKGLVYVLISIFY